MNVKALHIVLVILVLGSFYSSAQDSQTIVASDVSLRAFSGESAENLTRISNTLPQPLVLYAASPRGEIEKIVRLENTRVSIPPGETGALPIRLEVLPKTAPGVYNGSITLTTGNQTASLSVVLFVPDPWEELEVKISATPFKEAFIPGEAVTILIDIENILKRETNLTLLTQIIDPESKTIIVEYERNFSVTTVKSIVETLLPPKNIKKKTYEVKTSIYAPHDTGKTREIASASLKVGIGLTATNIAQIISHRLVTFSNIQVTLAMLTVLLFILLTYWQYRVREERRKRYLSMVSFDYLPKPGKRSGYLGRVAETTKEAFIELDVLQTHTLCAGATGSGKTIAAQVIIEEALLKNIAVIVFDPTGQWTGYLTPCNTKGMLRAYPMFKMKKSDAKAFTGNIHTIENEKERIDVRKYMNPGEITIFSLHKLEPKQIDVFIDSTIQDVFASQLAESSHCRLLLVYDEVHRLLPKFGGSGRALVGLERAVREFRKWGVGLVLLSQVLSDFVGEIKANIGTEIQMRTRYEKDLERIRLKYGFKAMRSIIKASIGTGMLQNAEYNQGRPYFVSFRPILHDPHRLPDETLELFGKYNKKLDEIWNRVDKLSAAGVDVFDVTLEVNLAVENIRKTAFDVVELYVQGLEDRVQKLERKLASQTLSEEETALVSGWDAQGPKALSEFHSAVEGEAASRRDSLLELEEEIKRRMESQITKLERRRAEIKEKLTKKLTVDEKKKLLAEHEEVVEKEKEVEEKLLEDMEDIVRQLTRSEGMLWRITGDRKAIESGAGALSQRDEELKRRIEQNITSIVDDIVERRRDILTEDERASLVVKATNTFKKYLMKKAWQERQLSRRRREEGLVHELTERKGRVYQRSRKSRTELAQRKDSLLSELNNARGKWDKILENEKLIREKESQLTEKKENLLKLISLEKAHIASEQKRITEERARILDSVTNKALMPGVSVPSKQQLIEEIEFKEKKIDEDFAHLETEWKKMENWLDEAKQLDDELVRLRGQWDTQER
ncbi:MAG: helicase HerA-like domain-containing protein, partial [Candidatus Altiarchaeota archaeon]